MIFDVIFDVTVCLSFQYHKILEFWHHHCVPRVKICIHTNFQLNLIICWNSNIIWMTFWTNLWSLTSYLASQYRLTPSKSQNVKILTSQSVFHPKKLAFWDQQSHFIEISGVFQVILGPFWVALEVHDVTRGVKILEFCILDFVIGFPSPKTLPMLIVRSKQSFYRAFWHFS